MHNKQNGVTLIELMVVVAIVAVLAAIAYPSYRNQITRSHRTEGKAALVQVQVAQEKWYLQANTYTTSLTELQIPATTTNGYYQIAVPSASATAYKATATIAGGQSDDTRCKIFSIIQSGMRDATSADCW